jgi:polyhydroxyalkanoate synthesis regulator protein
MITIIRYKNRKLYNRETSRYINQSELRSFEWGSYRVLSKETGADLTLQTVFQALANAPVTVFDVSPNVMYTLIEEIRQACEGV